VTPAANLQCLVHGRGASEKFFEKDSETRICFSHPDGVLEMTVGTVKSP
jgi:hypothetical protein